jgi:heat shock protein HslJ
MLALLALVLTANAARSADFRARGNEPGWTIEKTDMGISFRTMDGKTVAISPLPPGQKVDGGEIYRSTTEGQSFTLSIFDMICTDTMSGMPHPASVVVEWGSDRFTGCGGEPADLLRGEWVIGEINGKSVLAGSEVSLSFGADGQLSGNASCNRYFGSYALTGEGLTISELGSSRMLCEQPAMQQEELFLAALRATKRFEIGPDGALSLHGTDGRSLTANRKR